ncbi:MAG: hypothetical protein HDR88_10535 [Bacteroides sp.]|nr:hypothetical protein [Bacteroides sp.]
MNPQIQTSLQRLKDTISEIERLDSSYWNISLGTSHLNAYAEQLVNDAKTTAAHLKAYGKK